MWCSIDIDGFELALSKYVMSWEGIVHVRVRHPFRFELTSIVCSRCFIKFNDLGGEVSICILDTWVSIESHNVYEVSSA